VLAREVQKMIDAGHLRPGYVSSGIIDNRIDRNCGDDPVDYWHAPGETIVTLLDALDHLPAGMQAAARSYIQSEFRDYPPYAYNHIGWTSGASREAFDLPPDVESGRKEFKPRPEAERFDG